MSYDPTEKEMDLARKYLRGEYTEVQFNYWAVQYGSDKERMERAMERISSEMPLALATKFILLCILLHFMVCTAYSLVSFFLD